jgi:ketosteroid isomerase-like protein
VAVDRRQLAQEAYRAFAAGDRDFYEEHLADDLRPAARMAAAPATPRC